MIPVLWRSMSQSLAICHAPFVWIDASFASSGLDHIQGFFNARGHSRIEGYFSTTFKLDYLVIEWTDDPDPLNPLLVTRAKDIPQDPGDISANFVYPIDIRNLSRFFRLRWKFSGGGFVDVRAEVYGRPDNGGPPT